MMYLGIAIVVAVVVWANLDDIPKWEDWDK